MSVQRQALLRMHLCVLLWGFTAILGKLISLPALALVWWRMALVTATLAWVPRVRRELARLPAPLILAFIGVGVLIALHWLTFYAAIKLANASVAVICIAVAPVFVAAFEPLVTGKRFDPRELALAVAVLPGVLWVVGTVPPGMGVGFAVGLVSALLVALFGVVNKRLIGQADPITVSALEMGFGALFLLLVQLVMDAGGPPLPAIDDALLLLVLALFCTLLPFVLSLFALRHISAFSAQLAVNLEPVYAIVLAVLWLNEQRELSLRFYLGVVWILAAVFVHPWLRTRREKPAAATLVAAEAKPVAE